MPAQLWPIALVALYGLVLATTATVGTAAHPVPTFPRANLLDKPLGEDAFYMFSVARALAAGRGISYGGVPTTGVQPLATFAYAGMYWVSARLGLQSAAPLRMIIVFNVALLLGAGVLAGRLVERWLRRAGAQEPARGLPIAAIVVVVNGAAFRLFGYGLETGLYVCLILLLQLSLETGSQRSPRVIQTGAVLGLTVLARLDFVVIAAVVFGWRVATGRLRVRDGISMVIVALTIVGPWLLYVYSVIGGIMPSSGAAERGLPGSAADLAIRSWAMASAVAGALSSILYVPVTHPLAIVATLTTVAAAMRWLGPHLARVRHVQPWIAGGGALALYYTMDSSAAHFYARYLAPLWLFWTELIAAAVALASDAWTDDARRRTRRVATAALLLVCAGQLGYTLHRGHSSNTHLFSAFYIDEHAAGLGTVGAFQSGLIGYMNGERTVNLDGKLDYRALRSRGHLECYMRQRDVMTVIDWPAYIDNGWISRPFVESHMHKVASIPGGSSTVMAIDWPADAVCP